MLDVCLLGTAGMMPLPYRWLTALMTRYNGSSLLIDCGEGTQIAMKEKGWRYHMLYPLPCRSHQRPAGTFAHDGQCGADKTADDDRAERLRTGGKCAEGHCAGAAL